MKKITNKRAIEVLVEYVHLFVVDEGDKYWQSIELFITDAKRTQRDFEDLKEWLLQKGARTELK